MKNNVIQFFQNSHNMYDFDFESLLGMILDHEDDLEKPICKSARLDKDGKQYDEEFFSNKDGEIICGLILHSFNVRCHCLPLKHSTKEFHLQKPQH